MAPPPGDRSVAKDSGEQSVAPKTWDEAVSDAGMALLKKVFSDAQKVKR